MAAISIRNDHSKWQERTAGVQRMQLRNTNSDRAQDVQDLMAVRRQRRLNRAQLLEQQLSDWE